MKKISRYLVIFLFALLSLSGLGQQLEKQFQKRDEVFFTFRISSKSDLKEVNNMISIDNVKGDSVWAYANLRQFLQFLKLNFQPVILPHPGDGPGVVMKDYDQIRSSPLTVWTAYPTYDAYVQLMTDFQTNYPAICQVTTIATLTNTYHRKLMVAKISDNVATDEAEPEFLYTSSMHGNETAGYILMLDLIDLLLSSYGTNPEITDLVNNMEIYICPLANPDGTYYGGNSTVTGSRRGNYNNIDLNRNYPDLVSGDHPDGNAWQEETVAFMNFATAHHFVAGSNFHGGTEVVNYPWDTKSALTADDTWWQYVSKEYVDSARTHGNSSYMTVLYSSGITNGFVWYEANGTRQDYMNYWHHCREHTIELSSSYVLPTTQMQNYWNYNYRSLILYMKQARYGIHGIITSGVTGLPVAAKVVVSGHDFDNSEVYSSSNNGDYHRLIKGGTWTLVVSADGYTTKTITGVVVSDHATTNLDIQLWPGPSVVTQAATSVTGTTATLNGTVNPNGLSVSYAFEWGTTTSYGNSTTSTSAGSGTSAVAVNAALTGLSSGTTYHYRLTATNSYGTTYGSDMTLSTTCGTYNTLPFTESFTSTSLPTCWTQADNSGNGQIWQFGTITGYTGYNPSLTGNYAYLNSDYFGSGYTQNVDLITPTFDLSAYSAVTLGFKHYFRSYSGSSGKVYYSINNGSSWTLITTFSSSTANPATFSQAISAVAGQSQVKFKWNYTGSNAWYWAVDDVSITGTLGTPVVSTTTPGSITTTSAASGGTVSSQGSATVSARGVCWSTSVNPIVSGSHTTDGSGTGTFTSSITGLTPGILYHVRAYATNSYGTAYGTDLTFTTSAAPTLSVTPSNQNVTNPAGSTSFSVTTTAAWTASSDQSWCSVTPSGTGNGTITANYTQNNTLSQRVANITVTVTGLTPVTVTVRQDGLPNISVTLNIFLEGLYAGNGVLNAARDANGVHWTDPVADKIDVELHSGSNYSTTVYSATNINLTTSGTAAFTIPTTYNSNYYIVIRHRNSILTVSSTPISFSTGIVSYSFTDMGSRAYGSNLVTLQDGKFAIHAGDANQDGIINSADIILIDSDAATFLSGYLVSDINGDGVTDATDLILADQAAGSFISSITP